jgi:hypothetical protein
VLRGGGRLDDHDGSVFRGARRISEFCRCHCARALATARLLDALFAHAVRCFFGDLDPLSASTSVTQVLID